jgi:hypothetical protein
MWCLATQEASINDQPVISASVWTPEDLLPSDAPPENGRVDVDIVVNEGIASS